MKILILACLLGVTLAAVPLEERTPPLVGDYHTDIGIPEAARIKAAEEAMDFSGVRVVGGSPASLGQFPHLGGLLINLNSGGTSVCGSSLISSTRSVTAAHCWFHIQSQAFQLTVILGSITLFSGGTRVTTSTVVTHPNYSPATLNNDVAVISFDAISLNNHIQPIALATGNDQFVGTWATAAGFGLQADGTGISGGQVKHHVNVQVISNSICWWTYYGTIIDSTICVATTGGRSTCGGDSGGPLETNVNGKRTLIGITSFGHIHGCEINHPAGFARVTSFRPWLLSI